MRCSHFVVVGALVFVIGIIALAWWLVIRRLNEGNFEVGRPLRPDGQARVRRWSAARRGEREQHVSTGTGRSDQARDRNVGRSWGG